MTTVYKVTTSLLNITSTDTVFDSSNHILNYIQLDITQVNGSNITSIDQLGDLQTYTVICTGQNGGATTTSATGVLAASLNGYNSLYEVRFTFTNQTLKLQASTYDAGHNNNLAHFSFRNGSNVEIGNMRVRPYNSTFQSNFLTVDTKSYVTDTDAPMPYGFENSMPADGINCVAKGTKILTPEGYKNIESLNIGDLVINQHNKESKIKQIETQIIDPKDQLYIIDKHSLDNNLPIDNLFLTGYHAVRIDGNFIHPNHNLNNKIRLCPGSFAVELYHIMLEDYNDNLIANGLEVESLTSEEDRNNVVWTCCVDNKYCVRQFKQINH